jgi:phosphatidate cytidylyltransferase
MIQRIITGVLFTLAIILLVVPAYWWPGVALFLFAAVAIVSRHELDRALSGRGLGLPPVLSRIGSAMFLLPLVTAYLLHPSTLSALGPAGPGSLSGLLIGQALLCAGLVLWATFAGIVLLMRHGPPALPRAVVAAAALFYVSLPLGTGVILLFFAPQGWFWLVLSLASPWISDVFAYFTGSALGRHKIVPQISPKKSIEGSLGGLVGGIVAVGAVMPWITGLDFGVFVTRSSLVVFTVLGGILLSIASQFGDWVASAVKRWCDVKDFGHFLPGHGGMLDRFDSVLFTMPVTLILAIIYTFDLKGIL